MKFTRLLAALCSLALVGALSAQSTVTTERSVQPPVTAVETRTVVTSDGKTVTERVTTTTQSEREAVSKTYSAAIVVSNRADAQYNDKLAPLEDLLSARLTDLGFNLVSRELVAGSLRTFTAPAAAVSSGSEGAAAVAATAEASAASAAATEAAFTDQSSALRLAQSLGVDYLLHASITSYSKSQRNIQAYGVAVTNFDYTLRVAYKILDARAGGSLTGDVVKASRTEQGSDGSTALLGGVLDDLLDDAARQITASLRTRVAAGRITAPAKADARLATVTLAVEAADLFIPDVRINAENVVTVGESKFKVTPLNATVEIDGVAVGTAPGKITVRPGFSRLRISREGFLPWERTINAVDGQTLTIAMTMTPEGLARFKESTAFINDLKNEAKLTDARAKEIEGKAKALENSFFRVDTKENFRFILPEGHRELEVNQQNTTINAGGSN
ncbi:MAG: hypothetical protein RL376_1282 [Verrucomicrobiota bacterium]